MNRLKMSLVSFTKSKKVVLSEKLLKEKRGVVVLSIDEYRNLCERAVPVYYLKGKAAKSLDNLVDEGIEEYKKGKTKKNQSLSDLR
jgi:hypothetical protein